MHCCPVVRNPEPITLQLTQTQTLNVQAAMTNWQASADLSWFRVDLPLLVKVSEIHLFLCGRYVHRSGGPSSCTIRTFDVEVYQDSALQQRTWKTTVLNLIEGVIFRLWVNIMPTQVHVTKYEHSTCRQHQNIIFCRYCKQE